MTAVDYARDLDVEDDPASLTRSDKAPFSNDEEDDSHLTINHSAELHHSVLVISDGCAFLWHAMNIPIDAQ